MRNLCLLRLFSLCTLLDYVGVTRSNATVASALLCRPGSMNRVP